MAAVPETLRGVVRGVIVPSGTPSDSASVAAASVGVWAQAVAQLAPVIGPRGVDSLFRRSIQIVNAEYPWLTVGHETSDGAFPAEAFAACLAARDPETAAKASIELLAAFTELLRTLVGPDLAGRMLDPVWSAPAPIETKESTP